jgi:hypothetical protein
MPWDTRNERQDFALYRNTTGGYTDQWGQYQSSICMACHAMTPEAQRNMQGSLGGNLGWAKAASLVLQEALPYAAVGIAAKVSTAVTNTTRIATEAGLSAGEITRIQNAANRIGKPINLVGSRASGTANAASDWDYVIEGMTNANKNTIKKSLPGAPLRADQAPRNIDFFTEPLRTDLPHVQFNPR